MTTTDRLTSHASRAMAPAALLTAVLLSGCYTTQYVRRIGLVRERLSTPLVVYLLPDTSVVAEVEAEYYNDMGLSVINPESRQLFKRKRWIYCDVACVRRFAACAGANDTHARIRYPETRPRTADFSPARILPDAFEDEAGAPPLDLSTAQTFHRSPVSGQMEPDIRITLNDKTYIVWFEPETPARSHREWWGYPSQVLLVPAVIIDIVTFPMQAVYFWQELGRMFR